MLYLPVSDLRLSKLIELDNLEAPSERISFYLLMLVVKAVTVIPNLAAY